MIETQDIPEALKFETHSFTFVHRGQKRSIAFEPGQSDWWITWCFDKHGNFDTDAYGGKPSDYPEHDYYDVHYCEEAGEICVYYMCNNKLMQDYKDCCFVKKLNIDLPL